MRRVDRRRSEGQEVRYACRSTGTSTGGTMDSLFDHEELRAYQSAIDLVAWLEGVYPMMNWNPGDYAIEEYKLQIPRYQKKGNYSVLIGLYKNAYRVPIVGGKDIVQNAYPLTKHDIL